MKGIVRIAVLLLLLLGCGGAFWYTTLENRQVQCVHTFLDAGKKLVIPNPLLARCPLATGFDFPVGKPDAKHYYNAQPFGKNNHLGDDWNGVNGGDSDLGDPVYAIADGVVSFAEDVKRGWGNVVRIYHKLDEQTYVESLYGHLEVMSVAPGDIVTKGQQIGTIGNVGGRYYAHLHFEIRTEIDKPLGGGYSTDTEGFIDPTAFIRSHRR